MFKVEYFGVGAQDLAKCSYINCMKWTFDVKKLGLSGLGLKRVWRIGKPWFADIKGP